MHGYSKLFGSIVASTIWQEPNPTRILWMTMIAIKNPHDVVEASVPGLASIARITVPECEAALAKMKEPDPYSRTKEFEGRRIQEVDGGWLLLNGEKYRRKMNEDERREYNRIKQQECRDKQKAQENVVKTEAPARTSPKEPMSGLVTVDEWVKAWAEAARAAGADFTDLEARAAWLALEAKGWKYTNGDPRAALEDQINFMRAKGLSPSGKALTQEKAKNRPTEILEKKSARMVTLPQQEKKQEQRKTV